MLRIGTRRSPLALAQAREVAERLRVLGAETELVPIVTSGDRGLPVAGSPSGLKGLFVAEIVRALLEGEVDLAVHSAKDLPSGDPPGLVVAAVPERADPFDVLVTRERDLEGGAVVGTSSLRRQAQLRRLLPAVSVRDIRGNVDTRLRKLEAGELDALVLAAAGLARLGLSPEHARPVPLEDMVPAPGQGALAVQARSEHAATPQRALARPAREVLEMVKQLDHPPSRSAFESEREVVRRLGGGCALPLGAYAESREDGIRLMAVVIAPDGSDLVWAQAEASTPHAVASEVADSLLAGGAGDILAAVEGRPAP